MTLPARTAGTVVLAAEGSFDSTAGPIDTNDVVSARAWTPLDLTSRGGVGIVMTIDTAPAMRALGLYREEPSP